MIWNLNTKKFSFLLGDVSPVVLQIATKSPRDLLPSLVEAVFSLKSILINMETA